MRSYVQDQPSQIFSQVICLIYVFDIHSRVSEVDLLHYESILEALRSYSPDALIYTLLHKHDLLQDQHLIKERRQEIEKRAIPSLTHCYNTSIWDETLYKAWSSIVHGLLPDVKSLEMRMIDYAAEIRADEIVLFEPNTMLVLAQAIRHGHHDHHRFEKISSIVKQFRLSSRRRASPKRIEVRTGNMVVLLERVSPDAIVLITGKKRHLKEDLIDPSTIDHLLTQDCE